MTKFKANSVVVDDSDEAFILVGFADEQDGRYRESLHFQRAYKFDAEDVRLKQDQVYVERGTQSGCAYGGITTVELYPDRIRVVVTGNTAEELRDTEFVTAFSVPPDEFVQLRAGLKIVFQGFGVFIDTPE